MLGLVIAAIIFTFSYLGADADAPLLMSVVATFPFLLYWHWIWAFVKCLFPLMIAAGGTLLMKDPEYKVIGAAALVAAPIFLIWFVLTSGIYISSIYCLQYGIDVNGVVVNQKYAVVGAILYASGLIMQLLTKLTGSSNINTKNS